MAEHSAEKPQKGYETSDVSIPVAVVFITSLVLVAVFGIVASLLFINRMNAVANLEAQRELSANPLALERGVPAAPLLQPNPPADMDTYLAEENAHLHGYGWINREAGIVHIPIGQAVERVVQQGIPRWDPVDSAELTGDEAMGGAPGAQPVPEQSHDEP
jgi:hypothetical protein